MNMCVFNKHNGKYSVCAMQHMHLCLNIMATAVAMMWSQICFNMIFITVYMYNVYTDLCPLRSPSLPEEK